MFTINEDAYIINSVEHINNISAQEFIIGLLIKQEQNTDLSNLESMIGQTIIILE
jgi:hypothetical protein